MKRFYSQVSTQPVDGGHALLLDNRPVRTPLRAPLVVPSQAMADAIAEEWAAQGEDIVIASMPLTGFANAAIDQVAPQRQRFVDDIAAYGETDTLCYRADPGDPLAQRQDRDWEPILQWAENRYDIRLIRVAGIIHQPQSTHSLSRLKTSVNAMDAFTLAGFSTLVGIGGSLVSALALLEQAFDSGTIWQAICLEELWQEELWGADPEAVAARENRRAAFDAAWRFCCSVNG
jgi:chaperone required for assembly of F1-ATPase